MEKAAAGMEGERVEGERIGDRAGKQRPTQGEWDLDEKKRSRFKEKKEA